jgi:sec-independent protein translocase protein TatA
MCGLGTWELLIVLAIVVLLFGATRLPQLGRALGETVRNFKKGSDEPDEVGETGHKPIEGRERQSVEAHEVGQLVDSDQEREPAERREHAEERDRA